MTFMGLHVVLKDKSVVGNAIQGWLSAWMTANDISFSSPTNAQEPPDFWVGEGNAILEVKSFDLDASANFDVANFEAYKALIVAKPEHLDADYLIFGYTLRNGVLKIEKMWLKKIWEITCGSSTYPIKNQTKRGQIYAIRPATWYSIRNATPVFESKSAFLKALKATTLITKGRNEATRWYDDLEIALGINPDEAI